MSILSDVRFHDEQAAYDWVEAQLWPDGPVCVHCGSVERISKMGGKSTRIGTYKCYACRKPFTVKIGTIFEKSHVQMHIWLQAFHLLASSKKGFSANQLHRILKVSLQTAWFIGHRVREAMRSGSLAPPMGGAGSSGVVEADETFIGRKKGVPKRRGIAHKHAVLTLVERGGAVRSVHVADVKADTLVPIVNANIAKEARVMTDDAATYYNKLEDFAEHGVVNHSAEEYVRGDIHTNTVEGYFSIFKRGMKGVYQHCDERHLHRYLSEFDFRYSNRVRLGVNDEQRAVRAIKGVKGKRLTYRTTSRKMKNDEATAPTQGS
jgi:transposase-like protein